MKEFNIELSVRQTEALDLLFDRNIQEVLYGGAKGGGKSVFLCYSAVLDAEYIIKLCNIDTIPKYPYLIGFLGRLQSVDFGDTTLETWKKFISPDIYEIRQQDKEIILFGGKVKYGFGGLDSQENINKFNSAELPRIKIDQAEELSRDQAARLRGTQGRSKINGIEIPCNILWTANPAECFLKEDFNPHNEKGIIVEPFRRFVQALPTDNTFIDSRKYIDRLSDAWKHHPEILKAYVEGDWSSTAGSGFLITNDECQRLTQLVLQPQTDKCWLSNDPAWLGEKVDEIVWYVFKGNRVIDSKFGYNQETTHTAGDGIKLARQYRANTVGIDCIGIGAGVVSDCRALAKDLAVLAINSASKPIEDIKIPDTRELEQPKVLFTNIRAEQYWIATEELKQGKWVLPNDPELIRQLCAVKYFIKNGKIQIEEKKDIKARLGRSPDRADAYVQGIWMKKYVKNRVKSTVDNYQPEFHRGKFR